MPEKTISLLTPYDFSGKPFCGIYTGETFRLTKNSHWRHIKSITIIGRYEPKNNDKTEVTFEVGNPGKRKVFVSISFILMLAFVNTLLVFFSKKAEISTLLAANGWIVFMFLFGTVLIWFSRFIVSQRFKEEFDIDIKHTDLCGYGAGNEI